EGCLDLDGAAGLGGGLSAVGRSAGLSLGVLAAALHEAARALEACLAFDQVLLAERLCAASAAAAGVAARGWASSAVSVAASVAAPHAGRAEGIAAAGSAWATGSAGASTAGARAATGDVEGFGGFDADDLGA
ncbi:MAG: hypothetical protein AAFU77_18455, partial [Myxococcota bacterium]